MTRERAIAIGQDALIWLAGRPDEAARFFALSGVGPTDIRARAGDPEFLGFVLDFLLASDRDVLAFAADAALRPEDPARARAALPGGDLPHWT